MREDSILKLLKESGEPATLEKYTRLAFGKAPNQLSGEERGMVPEQFDAELEKVMPLGITHPALPDLQNLDFDPALALLKANSPLQ